MATVNFIPESNQSISAMKAVIDYCLQQKKVADEDSGRRLVSGVNCNGENSFTEFMVTKNAHKKKGGITFYHYVQSFSPRENVSADQVHKIGLEFAEKAWPGHEVLVTTHTDAEHLHNHFVINSVHYENGNKLRQNPGTLTRLRTLSDSICNEHGLSVLKPYKKDGANISSREYRAAAKGESWKFRLMADINSAMNKSGSKEDFISALQRKGYEITWTDERKYITFTCPNGKKCRDKTLHDEKYLKENIEYELQFRQQHYRNRKQFSGELHEEKCPRNNATTDELSARYGADSGKGLGYDGESVTVGGGFSTEGVRPAANPSDRIENEIDDGAVDGNGKETFPRGARRYGEQAEYSADGGGEYFITDEEPRTTGWESSRKNYERYLGTGQGTGEGYRQGTGENRSPHMDYPHGDIGGSLGVGGGVINSALRSMAGITDSNEDPEERRKRIEAQENASNLGAIIGLAVGAIVAMSDADNTEDTTTEETETPTLKM